VRRDQINIRVPHILKKILIDKENMSEFIIEAIEDKLRAERNPEYVETMIRELRNEIKSLQRDKDVDPDNIIEGFYQQYQDRVFARANHSMFKNWIKDKVKPSLIKIGYHGSVEDILNLFKEYKS
jgi:hypothetical protein